MMLMSRCDPYRVWSWTTQLTVLIFILVIECPRDAFGWHMSYIPNSHVTVDGLSSLEVQTFEGNITSPDHFKLLLTDGNSIIVGARNYLYNISLITLKQNKRIEWYSKAKSIQTCRLRMKTTQECQNYIRVVAKMSQNYIYVCGTHAFDPTCRTYRSLPDDSVPGYLYEDESEEKGTARCPYDPSLNSTSLYTDGTLYSATYADFLSRDALIYTGSIRTEQYDSKWLNDPNFVSTYEYGEKIYYFFRETSVEYINCGKAVYSRVAQICKKDNGGRMVLRDVFTSFFKARLNCSISGEFPFYFDEIQSTTEIGNGNLGATNHSIYRNDMIYGVFNTPENSITGSAICAYRFSDILNIFSGNFKEQMSATSAWLPADWPFTRSPHPAKTCSNDSKQIPDLNLNFVKSHVLMNGAVQAFGGKPILVQTSFTSRFTQIAVDWQVRAADRNYYDVMFIGTDDGRVLKAINKGQNRTIDTIIIEETQVFDDKAAVLNLQVYRNRWKGQEKLVVISGNQVRSIPLHRCHVHKTCTSCVATQDPYCSWSDACVNSYEGLQSVATGKSKHCKDPPVIPEWTTKNLETTTKPEEVTCPPCKCPPVDDIKPPDMPNDNELPRAHVPPPSSKKNKTFTPNVIGPGIGESIQGTDAQYSATTLAIALALSVVLALVLGIIVGYRIAMCRRTRSNTTYLDKYQKSDLERETRLNRNENYITSPAPQKQLNVVLNVKPKNNSADNKALHKVKKVYV
ncbi:semaphorin-1A-like isoform X2 [Lineus longissimus]|uniref:semaphorin-1A-like isoform X2 n=1 Tax=Lineus longissimus TaxID=88925 RepID=UPI002B4D78DD